MSFYDKLQSQTAKTLHFILTETWPCPLCDEETRIAKTHCGACGKDMNISKFAFERRLIKLCPKGIYDFPSWANLN